MVRQFLTPIDLSGNRITGVGAGVNPGDVVTKAQLDNQAAGIDAKQSVRAVATSNVTLSGTQTVDGVSLAAGERVLTTGQTNAAENGLWLVAAGAWTRTADGVTGALTSGASVPIESGSTNADSLWWLTTDGTITVGTTAQTWSKTTFGIAYTAGSGLTLVGTVFAVTPNTTHSYSQNVGDGTATSIAVTHSLGTRDVQVQVYDATTFATVDVDVVRTSSAVVTLGFGTAPASNAYRVVVQG